MYATADILKFQIDCLDNDCEIKKDTVYLLEQDSFQKSERIHKSTPHDISNICEFKNYIQSKNLRPACNSIYNVIEKISIIESYNLESCIQSYANKEFYKYSRYDINTLSNYPFYMLFERDPFVFSRVFDLIKLAIRSNNLIEVPIEPHYVKETKIDNGKKFINDLKYFCILKNAKGEAEELVCLSEVLNSFPK